MKSELELALLAQIRMINLPEPVREYPAITGRRFRFDLAWPECKLLVEVQGAIFVKGGHSSGTGIMRDHEKHNLAVIEGWRIIYANSKTIDSGEALENIETALSQGGTVKEEE
jgi:very-short-patch-repair endonuclease